MIWGLTLKPGESCTKVLDEEVHLSLASMESRKEFGKIWPGSYSQVVMKTEDVEVLLCTLVHGSIFQQNLDLKLMPKEKMTFTVYGDCIIYIVGYTSCLPHAEEVCDEFHHDTTIYEDDVYNQVDEENHLGDNNDERPSSWTPELLPKPQDSTQSGHNVKRTENADAPDVTIIIKEEESQDVIEDIYSEDDHHHHQQQQQQQQGCQQKMEQQEMQSVEVGESSLSGHMTQHDDSYQVSQDSQDEENFAVIADIDSFPEQVSIKKRKKCQDSQVDYVNQVNVVNFQSTSGSRESKYTRSSTSISNTSNAPCTILPKITSVRSAKSFSSSVSDWTPKSTNSSAEHLKPSLVANGSPTLTTTLAKSTRRTANPLFLEASSESKDHKCSVCRKTFTHISSLVRHERIHTGVKPYQCKVCFKPFSDAGNRAKHERSHMRMGKFACMYCGRTFDENTIRTQHQRMCPYMYKS